MLSPQDRAHFPWPTFLYGAQKYIGDAYAMQDFLQSAQSQHLDPEALANARSLMEHVRDVTAALLSITDADSDTPLMIVLPTEEEAA